MKPALLVIDMQKAFYKEPSVTQSMDSASDYINAALSWFREKSLPVFWIHHTEKKALSKGRKTSSS